MGSASGALAPTRGLGMVMRSPPRPAAATVCAPAGWPLRMAVKTSWSLAPARREAL